MNGKHTLFGQARLVVWSGLLGLVITVIGGAVWTALLLTNLKTSPAIPWSVAPMALILWLMWQYLGGKWWPRSTSETRRHYLRARRVPRRVFAWALLAGTLAMVALAGYWIVLFQLVRMSPNILPDYSKYAPQTVVLMIAMGSLVSPFLEEAGFRGYCQVILEKEFRAPMAVGLSSFFFMVAHLSQGFFWPKLLVYFLVGITFGAIAFLTNSTLPAIPVHILGLLIFFTLVWPHDAARRMVWEGGADPWFWVHVAQTVIFTVLAVLAFSQLARTSERGLPILALQMS